MLKRAGLITTSSLIVITSALGALSGWFLGNMFKEIGPVENAVYNDGEVIYSNNLDAVAKVLKASGKTNFNELNDVDITSLIGVNGLTVGDVAEAAQLFMYSKDDICVTSNNLAYSKVMGVVNNQITNSTWIKKGNLYFKENVSTSQYAKFGERAYNFKGDAITPLTKPIDNLVSYYRLNTNKEPSNVDFSKANSKDYFVNVPKDANKEGEDIKSFSTTYGTSLYKPFNYDYKETFLKKDGNGKYVGEKINNSKTNKDFFYETSIKKVETGYEIILNFNNEGLDNYASYIFTTTRDASNLAKMKEKPQFISTGVKITTDKNLLIQSVHSDEFYNVLSAITDKVPTVCSSDLIFDYSGTQKIPSIKEKISYGK